MVVLPCAIPVTTPMEFTLASNGLLLIHVPPLLPEAVNKIEELTQTLVGPEIVPALPAGFTVKVKLATEAGLQLFPATV